jgi:hypothetical protein
VTLVWVHGDERRSGSVRLAESRDSLPAWALGGLRWTPASSPTPAAGGGPRR